MYRLDKEIEELLERFEAVDEETERHYLFGLHGIFSFQEGKSVFSVIEEDSRTYLVHDYQARNNVKRSEADVSKEEAVKFLRKTGYEPFMRLDIRRYRLTDGEKTFVVENVKQLGYFTDNPELGGKEVFYGDLLKQEMLKSTEKEKEIREQAKSILQSMEG